MMSEKITIKNLIDIGRDVYPDCPGIVFFNHVLFEFNSPHQFEMIGIGEPTPKTLEEARDILLRYGAIKEGPQ